MFVCSQANEVPSLFLFMIVHTMPLYANHNHFLFVCLFHQGATVLTIAIPKFLLGTNKQLATSSAQMFALGCYNKE